RVKVAKTVGISRGTRQTLALCVALAQSKVGKWRIRERAVRDQPVTRGAVTARKIVLDDPEVVDRGVGEVWGPGAFADSPDGRRGSLKPVGDTHGTPTVEVRDRPL